MKVQTLAKPVGFFLRGHILRTDFTGVWLPVLYPASGHSCAIKKQQFYFHVLNSTFAMLTQISNYQLPADKPTLVRSSPTVAELLSPAITFIHPIAATPFIAIKALFDYLAQNPAAAEALNDTYALRGIFKTAATKDPACDQKLTIDLSPTRVRLAFRPSLNHTASLIP